jgi:peptidoglycan/LPS O-acetylase OafA/YrhL
MAGGVAAPTTARGDGLIFGKPLDPRRNSLNLIRFVLAAAVLYAHSFYLAGAGTGPDIAGENAGGWAVAGFFTISGFLITASRFSNSFGTYLVHRIARIYPAFIVCLLVTVFVFAPLGFLAQNGGLAGYLTTETTPARFLFTNLFLEMRAFDVAFSPATVPFPGSWNGSLWTLYYEFQCYLLIGVAAMLPVVRRSVWPLLVLFTASVAAYANLDVVGPYLSEPGFALLLRLLPFFLGGCIIQLLSRRIGFHWLPGILSGVVAVVLIAVIPTWGGQLASPLIAYFLLWFSTVLPSPALIKRHDISYGFYIYAWPVQQLLAVYGLHELGLVGYNALAVIGTAVLALASWLLVERPVMRRVRKAGRASGRNTTAPVSPAVL